VIGGNTLGRRGANLNPDPSRVRWFPLIKTHDDQSWREETHGHPLIDRIPFRLLFRLPTVFADESPWFLAAVDRSVIRVAIQWSCGCVLILPARQHTPGLPLGSYFPSDPSGVGYVGR
jgi:hypothetical protein